MRSVALITCSYGPDFERCRRLCRSAARYLDGSVEHLLVVPQRDLAMFGELADERTRVRTVESVMPMWIRNTRASRRWWLTLCSPPVRGWIVQQVTKIAVAAAHSADAVIFADSDVEFIRPFTPDQVWEGDRTRLLRIPRASGPARHLQWARTAGKLLGVTPTDWYGCDYIGQLVTWRPDAVRAMTRQIANVAGRPWHRVLCNTLHFSEYFLYGVFVEQVLGGEGHLNDDRELCHCSWHYTSDGRCDLDHFFGRLRPEHVAVLIQSNLGIEPSRYDAAIQRIRVETT